MSRRTVLGTRLSINFRLVSPSLPLVFSMSNYCQGKALGTAEVRCSAQCLLSDGFNALMQVTGVVTSDDLHPTAHRNCLAGRRPVGACLGMPSFLWLVSRRVRRKDDRVKRPEAACRQRPEMADTARPISGTFRAKARRRHHR